MPRPFLSLENVTLLAGGRRAFVDTRWEIWEGEQWGIIGPNGSGKSLLAAALCGQATLQDGRIRYHFLSEDDDRDARYGAFKRGTVLLVPVDSHRHFAERFSGYHQARWHASESRSETTVEQLLSWQSVAAVNPFEVVEKRESDTSFAARREHAIDALDMRRLLGRDVRQLSSGELRKLVLARAILQRPRLLVLDEPFAGLDADARGRLREMLDGLSTRGVQLVLVVARVDDLPTCIRRLLVVENHRVVSMTDASSPTTPPSLNLALSQKTERPQAPASARRREDSLPTMSQRGTLVSLRDVSVRYGGSLVLDGVNFTVHRGEHCAILGPNGAGKSTLLSLVLADHPQAYANDVELFGKRRGTGESIWDIKHRIGWVSAEIHAHYPLSATALEVVCSGWFGSIGLYADCTREQRERAQDCLSRFVPDGADRVLGELSYGEQRLVLIARALVAKPELLILDEPCHGLDVESRNRVLEALETQALPTEVDPMGNDGGATLLFVTHHEDEIPRCIRKIVRLRNGRVVQRE